MEQPQKLNHEIGLQEKNTILQAWGDFKDAIFNVLFVILDKKSQEEQEESLFGLTTQTGLDYLQMMAFPFSTQVLDAWNGGDSLNSLVNFFQKFSITTYLPQAPFSAFLVVLYGLIFIILLIIIDIAYVSYSFSKKKFRFTFPLIFLAQVVPLFVTVLFLPITQTLLNVVQCSQNSDGYESMTSFPQVICWKGWHLFHSSITLLFATIFVIISCVVALALFQPRMTTGKLTARQNSNGQVVFIINKIILQFIFTFDPFNSSAYFVIIMFSLSIWQFWCYAIKKPYYSVVATKFYKICSTYYFWTNFMLFIGLVFKSFDFDGALIIWISGLPFFGIIIYFENSTDINIILQNNLNIKSGQQLQYYISHLLQLIQSQEKDKNSYMLLIGYLQKHKQICNEVDCPIKSEQNKGKNRSDMQQTCRQILKQIERIFKQGIKKFPQCTKLRISFAFFQLEQLHNNDRAYQQFSNSSKIDPSFQEQFNIYRFKKIIKQHLQDRQQNESDLIETIRFQNSVSLLQQAMIYSAKLHKNFWTELKQEIPDLKKLNSIGSQITQAGSSILQNYNDLMRINSYSSEVLFIYGQYLLLISEDFIEGRQILANAYKYFQDKQAGSKRRDKDMTMKTSQYYNYTSPVLIVNRPEDKSIPIIKNINLMFTQITGFQQQQLVNRQITTISPYLFAKKGQSSFDLFSESSSGFIRHKFKHLISVNYEVVNHQSQNNQSICIFIFKLVPANSLRMIMLTELEGFITDYNYSAQANLNEGFNLNHLNCQENSLNICVLGVQELNNEKYTKGNGCLIPINFGQKIEQCMVLIQPVIIKINQENGQADDQQSQMIAFKPQHIGYKIIISKSQKVKTQFDDTDSIQSNQNSSQFDEGVLSLYAESKIQNFIADIHGSAQSERLIGRYELKEKITTMRLLNNEIKMVYSNNIQNMNDFAKGQEQQEQFIEFNDEGFQKRLKEAINTNLNHIEVIQLKKISIIFILLLFGFNSLSLAFQNQQIDDAVYFVQQMTRRAHDYSILTSNIFAAMDPTANYTDLYSSDVTRAIMFQSNASIQIILQNNLTLTRNLKDAFIMLNSRLISFFQDQNQSYSSVQSVIWNYINSIFPAFINHPSNFQLTLNACIAFAGATFIISLLMMTYWIYITLLIDKKRYDIMIWFLDIPVPYVMHLITHCEIFLKKFMSVKQLTQKGLPNDDEGYQQFSVKNIYNEEIQQQMKTRKSLISKNKRQNLINKIDKSSLNVIWLLFYSVSFTVALLILSLNLHNDYDFLIPQWKQTSQAITTQNTLYLCMRLRQYNATWGIDNLNNLIRSLEISHKGAIIDSHILNFNYNILSFHLKEIVSIYDNIYFNNVCNGLTLNPTNLSQCQSLVGNKLKSGYIIYSKYLIAPQQSKDSQIQLANKLYVVPALLKLLQTWQTVMILQGESLINICTIVLYIFVAVTTISYLLIGLYYLRRLNTELNQTIQMLNMIPFKLLPKSRKETKLFIVWIIREANKIRHQDQ